MNETTVYNPERFSSFCMKLKELELQDVLDLDEKENLVIVHYVKGYTPEPIEAERLKCIIQVLLKCFKEQISIENVKNFKNEQATLSHVVSHYKDLGEDQAARQLEKGLNRIKNLCSIFIDSEDEEDEIEPKEEDDEKEKESVKAMGSRTVKFERQDNSKVILEITSDNGNKIDQFEVVQCHEKRRKVPKNEKRAFQHLQEDASQGDPIAQFELAVYYEKGKGVKKNLSKAIEIFENLATSGNADAQFYLADYYREGEGVEKNESHAVLLYELAAKQGHIDAQFELAECYDKGIGVTQDHKEAFRWYKCAADQGHEYAQVFVARYLFEGWGVEKDFKTALKIFTELAYQGNATAQYFLGYTYLNGAMDIENNESALLPKDIAKGMAFLQLSADQGDPNTIALLEEIKRTPINELL